MTKLTSKESKSLRQVSKLFPVGTQVMFDLRDRHVGEVSGYSIEPCVTKLRINEGMYIIDPSICRIINWNV